MSQQIGIPLFGSAGLVYGGGKVVVIYTVRLRRGTSYRLRYESLKKLSNLQTSNCGCAGGIYRQHGGGQDYHEAGGREHHPRDAGAGRQKRLHHLPRR